ncbi:MAG: signal peptidase I [bacterium]
MDDEQKSSGANENGDVGAESVEQINNEESIVGTAMPAQDAERLKSQKRTQAVNEIKEWIKSIAIALGLALLLKAYVVQSYMIPTPSMVPTIMPKDRVFGNRFIYRFRDPRPGDVIAFKPPFASAETEKSVFSRFGGSDRVIPYLKRVIAVGGDTVEVRNRTVYINNIPLDEPYIYEKPNYDYPTVTVPRDDLFVMGDNRCNSHDSHVWGFLPKENVQAKAFFRFWPLHRIGVVR